MAPQGERKLKIIADNRKARFNFEIGEVFEAGIMLHGTEVKALRASRVTIAESYADSRGGELWLINSNIPEYLQGGRDNHEPKRKRKLLMHRRQIDKLASAVDREGMTIVPLKMYFNEQGRAKVEIALARGKKLHDKRETEKKRDWEKERGRIMRDKG
ncbi:MAG: SsrA-binding protein [Xanthobacteraceae bacterium]|jgi:SsrA-binding protein|nr:SsrA-binding protein [Xanthobacteraceae bacterium]